MMSLLARSLPSPGTQQAIKEVDSLLARLRTDLTKHDLSAQDQKVSLEKLKVLGRQPSNSGAIFAEDGISLLCTYAFDQNDLDVAHEASRCLANAMLLSEPSRQVFLDLGYAEKAVKCLAKDDRDDEFLLSRIIFLLTYGTTVDLTVLVRDLGLAKNICKNIASHARRLEDPNEPRHPMDDMALAETLKLLFNVTAKVPELAENFADSVADLFTILTSREFPSLPLQSPVDLILNALMNLDIPPRCASNHAYTERLLGLLESCVTNYPERELDKAAMPLVTLLRKFYTAASQENKQTMQARLLPDDSARSQPLGKDDSLPSRLLRLSASASLLQLHQNISTLLFELSDSDATKFIHNIGYGYAAGFLASNNIDVPQSAMQNGSASGTTTSSNVTEINDDSDDDINPITGQRRAAEPVDDLPEMTQEEKEREAERLFVLFERLRATGVVDVKNPVQQAMDEGRFEELDD
ncbi:hypothetical protein AAFC00_000515 [Neodothiora populina]|uniref:Uncharacterized protein n=1 Tax=Neodothiora populina TaxID=2781224 RepID=A0ABR3PD47_9PEZI